MVLYLLFIIDFLFMGFIIDNDKVDSILANRKNNVK